VLRTGTRLGLTALTACAVTTLAGPASAYSAQLDWTAPASCPDAAALRRSVERLLGEPLLEGAGVQASASVTADDDSRFTLTLAIRTGDTDGTRRVHTDTCENALEVAAFAIALALNPDLRVESPEGDAASTPTPLPPPPEAGARTPPEPVTRRAPVAKAPARPVATTRRSASDDRRLVELWVSGGLVMDSSLMPDPALGLGAGPEAGLARWIRIGVRPAVFLFDSERLRSGAGGLFSLWSLQAYACARLASVVGVCPVFQYGRLHAEGRGVQPPLEQTSEILAPGLAAHGLLPLSGAAGLRFGVTGLFPLSHDVFVVRDGLVHRLPRASLELSVGGAFRVF
jgi:hypothetical protein